MNGHRRSRGWGGAICRHVGCRWEVRTGYDYCPRCDTARWHLVRPPQPTGPGAARWRGGWGSIARGLERLDDLEGSDLFADSAALR